MIPVDSKVLYEMLIKKIKRKAKALLDSVLAVRSCYSPYAVIDFNERTESEQLGLPSNAAPFWHYEKVLNSIQNVKRCRFMPLNELFNANKSGICIGIRLDVEGAPEVAERCARLLAMHGIPSTFFLSHSALFYGAIQDYLYYRNPQLSKHLLKMIVYGVELGVLLDGCYISEKLSLEPHEVLRREVKFFRDFGIDKVACASRFEQFIPADLVPTDAIEVSGHFLTKPISPANVNEDMAWLKGTIEDNPLRPWSRCLYHNSWSR